MKNIHLLLFLIPVMTFGQNIPPGNYSWNGHEADKGSNANAKAYSYILTVNNMNGTYALSIASSRVRKSPGGSGSASMTGQLAITTVNGNKFSCTYSTTSITGPAGNTVPNKTFPIQLYLNSDGTLLLLDSFWKTEVLLKRSNN